MTLRIISKDAIQENSVLRGVQTASGPIDKPDDLLGRITKLIPAEGLAFYTAASSALPLTEGQMSVGGTDTTVPASVVEHPMHLIYMIVLGFALTILVRWKLTQGSEKDAQKMAVLITAFSYLLWVGSMKGTFGLFESLGSFGPLVAITAIAWTILIPLFYKGDRTVGGNGA